MWSSSWHVKQQRMCLCSPFDVSTVPARPHTNTHIRARAHTHTNTHTHIHTHNHTHKLLPFYFWYTKIYTERHFYTLSPFLSFLMLWHIRGSRKRPFLSHLGSWLKPFTHDQLTSISPRITGNELGAWQLFACALSLDNFARSTAQHWKQFTSVDCWVLPKNGYNNFTFSHEKQVDYDLLIAWLRSRVHISFRKMQTGKWVSVNDYRNIFSYKKVIY